MAIQAASTHARFVLAVGDNFYENGIDSDVNSARFESTFERPFAAPELNIPWYAIAGNHDHRGNVTAQIAYSKISPRWRFPELWYTFSESFTSPSGRKVVTQVVYLDTVVAAGMSYHEASTGAWVEGEPHPLQAKASSQLAWLERTLAASTADYLWVAGHYPVYSQCRHGPTPKLIMSVLPLLRKFKATGFISGHDHCLAHYAGKGRDEGIAFVVSGAGKECCYEPFNLHSPLNAATLAFRMDSIQTHGASGGFASVTATESRATISYYASNGSVLFKSKPIAPRGGGGSVL